MTWTRNAWKHVFGVLLNDLQPVTTNRSLSPFLSRSSSSKQGPAFARSSEPKMGDQQQGAKTGSSATNPTKAATDTTSATTSSSISSTAQRKIRRSGAAQSWRLAFLSKGLDNRPLQQVPKQSPSGEILENQRRSSAAVKKRKQQHHMPGFKARKYFPSLKKGDMVCPSCGSHNYSPNARLVASKVLQEQDQQQRHQQRTIYKSSSISLSSASAVAANALANCFCYECGHDLFQQPSIAPLAPQSREFQCLECGTANFGGRISCIGCGAMSPRVRDNVLSRINDGTTS